MTPLTTIRNLGAAVLVLATTAQGLFAQTVITIGTGTSTQRQPFGMYWGFERSAALYQAAEVTTAGTITSLAWHIDSLLIHTNGPVQIYLKHTSASTLASDTWSNMTAGATLVYNSYTVFTAGGWFPLSLSTPFPYNGSANLLVLVETNYGGVGGESSTSKKIRYSTTASQHQFWQQDNSPPTGNGSVNSQRPNIQITIFPTLFSNDIAAQSVNNPASGETRLVNVAFSPQATFRNAGTATQSGIPVKFEILDGSSTLVYTNTQVIGSLPPAGSQLMGFAPFIPTTPGTHTARAIAMNPGDQFTANDTASVAFLVAPVFPLPFTESFTGVTFPPPYWYRAGSGASPYWSRQTTPVQPNGIVGPAAKLAWYNAPEGTQDTLRTPVLDLSGTANVALRFYHAYRTYINDEPDSLRIIVSTDAGQTWAGMIFNDGHPHLATLPPSSSAYTPMADTEWRANTILIPAPLLSSTTTIAFVGQSAFGNNFWLDDVVVEATTLLNASISGMTFVDVNNNGLKDTGDFGLPTWQVVLTRDTLLLQMATTDSSGNYTFSGVPPGMYQVREILKSRWTQTFPPSVFHPVYLDGSGTPITNLDFGNYRLVTPDTARNILVGEVIPTRPDAGVVKAFQFTAPPLSPTSDGALPPGSVVRSWDSVNAYAVPREKYFFWLDLTGDLKYGHSCLYMLVDKATAEVETISTSWWPVVVLPSSPPMEMWKSWDERVTSGELIYGSYGSTPRPNPNPTPARPWIKRDASPVPARLTSGAAAMLIGGKAESATELVCWQYDLDSVRHALTTSVPPAVDSTNVFIHNNTTIAALDTILQQVETFDTLYFFFTGHGDTTTSEGGIVLNGEGLIPRVTLTYDILASVLFDSLQLDRLYMLLDATRSGRAIDDFMKPKYPVVNIVTATDKYHAAQSGLPPDTQSVYTGEWRDAERSIPLPPALPFNWRALNDSVRVRNVAIQTAQDPQDTSNAPLPVYSAGSIIFPDVAVNGSRVDSTEVENVGWISLRVDSVVSSNPVFTIVGPDTATLPRNDQRWFSIQFAPTTVGVHNGIVKFFHNGEAETTAVFVSGTGISPADTALFRTFVQDSLSLKGIKRKPFASKFCAGFTNSTGSSADGLRVEFKIKVDTTSITGFTTGVTTDSLVWDFSGGTIAPGNTATICGIGQKGKLTKVDAYWWKQGLVLGEEQDGFTPLGQQLLIHLPTTGNLRDTLFKKPNYFYAIQGMILGVPRPDSAKSYGWVRLKSKTGFRKFFPQPGAPGPFDSLAGKLFVKEKRNIKAEKLNNHLAAELAALRFAIVASALGKTPLGLGELIYDDETSNPLNGLMLKEIAAKTDTALTYWKGKPDSLYVNFDSTISKINIAFSGDIDTVSFATGLVLKGVRSPADVGYIQANPGVIPERIDPSQWAGEFPEEFILYQNFPNPFNPSTTIQFEIPEPSLVTLKIYNVLGQEVATVLEKEEMEDGIQDVEFVAGNIASGVYFYRIVVETIPEEGTAEKFISVRKMLLLK